MRFGELTSVTQTLRDRARVMDFEKAASLHAQGVPLEKLAEIYAPAAGMTKEAWLGAVARLAPKLLGGAMKAGKGVAKGSWNAFGKGVSGTATAAKRVATAPVRLPAKGLFNMAKKRPLGTAFAALTGADAISQGRRAAKAHSGAMSGIRRGGRYRAASRRAARIDPTHDIAPMSYF